MRLNVVQLGAVGPQKGLERPQLVEHVGVDLFGGRGEVAAAETDPVGKAGMRAYLHPVLSGERDAAPDRQGVTRVKATGEVGRRELRHQCLVLTELPDPEGLAEVGVEVDARGHTSP